MRNVLAIDDEVENLLLIEEYLTDDEYEVTSVQSAEQGLAYLEAGNHVHAILLDRMMPGMNGMEFLSQVKGSQRFKNIPVIMQTAAGTPAEIAEGIEAGVFYYLTKPFKRSALLSVLRNAIKDFSVYEEVSSELTRLNESLRGIDSCTLSIRTLQEVGDMSLLICRLFPDPEHVALGVRELLINAVEHGNAGITYDEKTAIQNAGNWDEEVSRRLDLPENRGKRVNVAFQRKALEIVLRIEDQGAGFDWNAYMTIDPSRFLDSHGRGIAMSKMLSFDQVEYVAPGNIVICTKKTVPPE